MLYNSHYIHSYSSKGNKQVQRRTVDIGDVMKFAGKSKISKKSVSFHEEDEVQLDKSKRISSSQGTTTINLSPKKSNSDVFDDLSEDDHVSEDDVPALGATTKYKLRLVQCKAKTNSYYTQLVYAAIANNEEVADDLLAKEDTSK